MWNDWWAERYQSYELLYELAAQEGLDANYWAQQIDYYHSSDYYTAQSPWPYKGDFDYETLAAWTSGMELGYDTYDVLVKRASTDLPGPIGMGMVLIQSGIENHDQGLARIGYEMVMDVAYDLVVDGVALTAAGLAGTAASGATPAVGALAAGSTFVLVEAGFDAFTGPYRARASDRLYDILSSVNLRNVHGWTPFLLP